MLTTVSLWAPQDDESWRLLVARCAGRVVALYLVPGEAPRDVADAFRRGHWALTLLDADSFAMSKADPFFPGPGTGALCLAHDAHDFDVNLRRILPSSLAAVPSRKRAPTTVRVKPVLASVA